ncbi:MAG: hypothetical protein ABIX01_12600 [Chitinophagaceae bacterium]
MSANKSTGFLIAVILSVLVNVADAQSTVAVDSTTRPRRAFVLHIGGGYAHYIAAVNLRPTGLAGSVVRSSVAVTFRFMWYPSYRLRLGFETGYTNFYSYNVKNGNVQGRLSLNAIPLLFVWSMPVVKRVNVYAGIGTFVLNTHLGYLGEVHSKAYVLGSNIALSYTLPLSRNLGLAAEGKWMNAFETKDATLGIQVQAVWRIAKL